MIAEIKEYHYLWRFCYFITVLACALVFAHQAYAQNGIVTYRAYDHPDKTRFVLELKRQPHYNIFTLSNPERVVVDLSDTLVSSAEIKLQDTDFITQLRTAPKEGKHARLVLDVLYATSDIRTAVLFPKGDGGFRLVIDLVRTPEKAPQAESAPVPVAREKITDEESAYYLSLLAPRPTPKPRKEKYKPVIIIDAGHGGHDPGAIGRRGTREKDITIEYAKTLYAQLKASGKYRPILTRNRDLYITLRGRVEFARKHNADLFISLHGNSHGNSGVKGLSIYTLSDRASDKEAAALARKENKEDIITGMTFEDADEDITSVLISIAQRDTMNQSARFAETIVGEAHPEIQLLGNPHRFAGFRVLTAADVPSVLVELGYLSNPREEKALNTESHKKKLVQKLVDAINRHFRK